MHTRRRSTLLAGALLTTVAVSGCGFIGTGVHSAGGNGPALGQVLPSPAIALARAADTTTSARSAKVHATIDIAAAARQSTVSVEGLVALDGSKGDITASMSAGSAAAPLTLHALLVGGVAYIDTGDIPAVPKGKWLKVDLAKAGVAGLTGSSTDFSQQLAQLKQYADVHVVGPDQVNGQPTTHYAGTLQLSKVLQALGTSGPAASILGKLPTGLAGASAQVDVWVSAQDVVVKSTQSASFSPRGKPVTVTAAVEYSDFGTPVNVTAPAAGDVIDFGNALRGLGARTS